MDKQTLFCIILLGVVIVAITPDSCMSWDKEDKNTHTGGKNITLEALEKRKASSSKNITLEALEKRKAVSSTNQFLNGQSSSLGKINSSANVSLHCSYDNREQTFTTKFTNNTSKTVLKIAVKISIKDLSMEYDMFDTRQYKYQTIIYDVEIPKGESVTQTRTVYIEDYSEYDGAFIDWVKYYNN